MKNKMVWIVASVLVIAGLLTGGFGCKAPTPTPRPTPVPSKPAGTLVVAAADLGPEVWFVDQGAFSIAYVSSCYDFLFYRDEEGKLIPGLVEKWEVSPDSRTYTFHLRKGIQFHNGWGELTAEDVKYSYELGTRKGTLNAALQLWELAMDKVEVIDPYTIAFRFKQFSVQFLDGVVRERSPQFPIVSKKYVEAVGIEQAGRKPIGTGPYKFVEHVFGDHITFEAVENHWRQTPRFKTLIIKKVPEESSRIAMLRAKEADIIDLSLDFKVAVVQAGFKIKSVPGATGYVVNLGGQWLPTKPTFNAKYPWVGDPRDPQSWERALKVRKALNLAVNRDEIVKNVLLGEGAPLAVPMTYPGSSMYDPALKPYPYDPEQAKRLLSEASYPNGFDITMRLLQTGMGPEASIISQAVAMMWEKIGVKVKLEPIEYSTHRLAMQARNTPGLAWMWGFYYYSEPVAGYRVMGYSKGGTPWMGVETSKLDELIEKTDAEPNDEQRAKLHRQLGQYMYDNYLTVPIAIKSATWGVSDRVGNWPLVSGMSRMNNLESVTHGPGFKP